MMILKYERVLRILFDEFAYLERFRLIDVDIECSGADREEICGWLEENGYITDVVMSGESSVTCTVENKMLEYFYK